MDDLVAFLRARLDERETVAAAAKGAGKGLWHKEYGGRIEDDTDDVITYDEGAPTGAQVSHIIGNDPAFVLADVAAKRKIIDRYEIGAREALDGPNDDEVVWFAEGLKYTAKALALPYANHPGYREEWAQWMS